jgi:hypothetical protein
MVKSYSRRGRRSVGADRRRIKESDQHIELVNRAQEEMEI